MSDLSLEVPKEKYHQSVSDGFKLLYPHGCKRPCTITTNHSESILKNMIIHEMNHISLKDWLKSQNK